MTSTKAVPHQVVGTVIRSSAAKSGFVLKTEAGELRMRAARGVAFRDPDFVLFLDREVECVGKTRNGLFFIAGICEREVPRTREHDAEELGAEGSS